MLQRLSLGLRTAVRMPSRRIPVVVPARAYSQAPGHAQERAEAGVTSESSGAATSSTTDESASSPSTQPFEGVQKVSLDSAMEFTPMPEISAQAKEVGQPSTRTWQAVDRSIPHRMHVKASRNNTIVTLTMPTGEPLATESGGTAGFRKAQRSGYEAGYRAAVRIFHQIVAHKSQWDIRHIEVLWNGFGQGREAVFRALQASEGEPVRHLIKAMTDKTPIKIGGVRPKKRRSTYCHDHPLGLTMFVCLHLLTHTRSALKDSMPCYAKLCYRFLTLDPCVGFACLGKTRLLSFHHAWVANENTV